jgi:hypothetical protein
MISEPRTPDDAAPVTVCRCGVENPVDASKCVACGRFLSANRSAEVHGAVTIARRGDGVLPVAARQARQERIERMLVDLGGADELSQLSLGLVDRAAQLSVMLDTYEQDFERRGMWTATGRQRASVTVYLAILDRYDKLAMRLGLERRKKDVGYSVEDWIREQVEKKHVNPHPITVGEPS